MSYFFLDVKRDYYLDPGCYLCSIRLTVVILDKGEGKLRKLSCSISSELLRNSADTQLLSGLFCYGADFLCAAKHEEYKQVKGPILCKVHFTNGFSR